MPPASSCCSAGIAGADPFNAVELLACGLKPITVCSDLLRPNGYARLGRYLEEIGRGLAEAADVLADDAVREDYARSLAD